MCRPPSAPDAAGDDAPLSPTGELGQSCGLGPGSGGRGVWGWQLPKGMFLFKMPRSLRDAAGLLAAAFLRGINDASAAREITLDTLQTTCGRRSQRRLRQQYSK